jgi:hypothetical protein
MYKTGSLGQLTILDSIKALLNYAKSKSTVIAISLKVPTSTFQQPVHIKLISSLIGEKTSR